MQSKDVRSGIVVIIILIIGMFFLMQVATGIIGSYQSTLLGPFQGLAASVQSFGTIIVMGGVALIILLLPLYFWKRRKEAKQRKLELQRQRQAALQRQEQLRQERMREQNLYRQQLRQRVYQQRPRYRYAKQNDASGMRRSGLNPQQRRRYI